MRETMIFKNYLFIVYFFMQQFNFNTFANSPEQHMGALESRLPSREVISPGLNHQQSSSISSSNSIPESKSNGSYSHSYHQNVSIPELKKEMQEALKPNYNTFSQAIQQRNSNVISNPNTFAAQSPSEFQRSEKKRSQVSRKKSTSKRSKRKTDNSFSRSRSKGKEMSKRTFNKESRAEFGKYPLEISLMKSDISLLSTDLNWDDLSKNLLELEVTVTDDILTLRQEKLTLMENYNKCLEDRYRVQREIHRLQKQSKDSSGFTNVLQSEKESRKPSGNLTQKNHEEFSENEHHGEYYDAKKYTTIQEDEEESDPQLRIQEEINTLRYKNLSLEKQLDQLQEKTQKIQEQRFETFFPHQNQPAPNVTKSKKIAQKAEVNELRYLKNQLLAKLGERGENQQLKYHFMQLMQENKQLQSRADQLQLKKQGHFGNNNTDKLHKLRQLQQYIREQEQAKQLFYQDLKKFKIEMARLKEENEMLRNR